VTGRAAANATPPGELGGTSVRLAGTTLLAEAADGAVRAFDAGTGVQRWSWPAVGTTDPGTRIVAVDAGHLSLLTDSGDLIAVDLRTGAQTSRYGLHTNGAVWTAGWVYAAAGYLFMERLQPGVPPSTSDTGYYFPSPDVLFGGTGLS
jgi:outer membrane protein assembly factor BamB